MVSQDIRSSYSWITIYSALLHMFEIFLVNIFKDILPSFLGNWNCGAGHFFFFFNHRKGISVFTWVINPSLEIIPWCWFFVSLSLSVFLLSASPSLSVSLPSGCSMGCCLYRLDEQIDDLNPDSRKYWYFNAFKCFLPAGQLYLHTPGARGHSVLQMGQLWALFAQGQAQERKGLHFKGRGEGKRGSASPQRLKISRLCRPPTSWQERGRGEDRVGSLHPVKLVLVRKS